ncbi:hypothetical protein KUK86_004525 [Vibrio parahaemolyticus]|nr:hypothetical protein [Vibrio parahaemolyticus]HCE3465291.1 hypothetical protein [Vibrio parahaemolyticus]
MQMVVYMKASSLLAVSSLLIVSGCTSITVEPVSNEYSLEHVCIQNNPKVIVDEFVGVVEDRFQYHGITTELVDFVPDSCDYKLTYTALRSWDFVPYLSHAELRLYKNHKKIAYGEYHLDGKGGLDMSKFDSVKEKMTPVIDQMLGKEETN